MQSIQRTSSSSSKLGGIELKPVSGSSWRIENDARFRPKQNGIWLLKIALVLLVLPNSLRAESQTPKSPTYSWIAEILTLSDEQAAKQPSVDLDGTVYFSDPYWSYLFVGQGEDMIFVNSVHDPLPLGSRVRIEGTAQKGNIHPVIEAKSVELVADEHDEPLMNELVNPISVKLDDIDLGEHDCQWVTLEAEVHSVRIEPRLTWLRCSQGNSHFNVSVPSIRNVREAAKYIGARVRVHGNLGCDVDDNVVVGVTICSPPDMLQIVQPAKEPLKVVRTRSVADLWDDREAKSFHLTGQVTFVDQSGFFLETYDSGRFIQNPSEIPVRVGSLIDVYGNREIFAEGGQLFATVICIEGSTTLPQPQVLTISELFEERPESQRVCIRGEYQGVTDRGPISFIHLRAEDKTFDVRMWKEDLAPIRASLSSVIEMEVMGTCSFFSEHEADFTLAVPSVSDVKITDRRITIDITKAIGLVAVASTLLAVALVWSRSLLRQVQKRKQDVAELTALLNLCHESIRDGILIVDSQGRLRYANQRISDLLGFDVAKDHDLLMEHRLSECVTDPEFVRQWQRINSSDDVVEELPLQIKATKGVPMRTLEVFTSPVRNEAGTAVARLWAFYDLTEKERLQESLVHAQKQEAIGQLAGGVAHDFNNLLTGIQGNIFVAQLDGNKSVGDVGENLEAAMGACKRATRLVSQLLGFSRKARLDLSTQNVNDIVNRMMPLISHALPSNDALAVKLQEDIPLVKVDGVQIEQVLMNICLNACDAISEGGHMTVQTYTMNTQSSSSETTKHAVISISDSGIGIHEDTLPHIFEPFFTTKYGKGTGLGLAMSEGIIRQHGGWIECDSVVSVGTEFRIYLPTTTEQMDVNPTPIDSANRWGLDGLKVLVVDDEDFVRKAVAQMLETEGATVFAASDGKQALKLIADHDEIELVLLDWRMPGMGGKEVLRNIKEVQPELATIICSGYVFDCDDVVRAASVAPDGVLQKPFGIKRVTEAAQEALLRARQAS